MTDVEARYPAVEKVALALVMAACKLPPYFQANPIAILTNHPLQSILAKLDLSGRLVKWAVGLVLADLLADFAGDDNEAPDVGLLVSHPDCTPLWQLWVDGAATKLVVGQAWW